MLKLIGNIKANIRIGEVSRPEYKIVTPSKEVSFTYKDRDSVLIIEKRATTSKIFMGAVSLSMVKRLRVKTKTLLWK